MKTKRLFAILLSALMLSSSLVACSDTTNDDETTPNANTPNEAETTPDETETDDPYARVDSGLPEMTFNGHKFNIFVHSSAKNDFEGEEITGEPILDAEYERMTTISDKCDIEIQPQLVNADNRAAQKNLSTSVMAGTNDYDLACLSAYSACNAMTSKLLMNLNKIDYLNFNNRWWDHRVVEDFSLGDKLYFMTGDISMGDNDATFCIYFNKQIAEDNGMPNFYEMVNNKTWTIDNFKTFAEQIGEDTDNDGNHVNDKDDTYGIYIWDDIMMGIVNAGDIKCCEVNDKGEIELTLYSEKFVNLFDKFASYAYNKDITCAYQRNGYDKDWGQIAFMEDRALFYMQNISSASTLREMETDFGILPLPLYDESQESYQNSMASWSTSFYTIPKNSMSDEEFARTGYITEYLAYEGLYTLTPAYYEKTLKGKASRDEESAEMLDLIFSTRAYDFGWYLEIGNYNESIMNLLRNYSTDVSSMYQKANKMATKVLKKYNETIAELD